MFIMYRITVVMNEQIYIDLIGARKSPFCRINLSTQSYTLCTIKK